MDWRPPCEEQSACGQRELCGGRPLLLMSHNQPFSDLTPAADEWQPGFNSHSRRHFRSGRMMRLSAATARGAKVTNYDNEELGKIEDFMFDMATGRLGYALLSPQDPADPARLFPVPLRALTVDADGEMFLLNVDRAVLRFAPAFERRDWPDTVEPRWRSGIESFYSF